MAEAAKKLLTWEDYENLPDDGMRYEILGGELFVTPAPHEPHQRISWALSRLFILWQERTGDRGEFRTAPFGVEIAPHMIVEPDLVYVRAERAAEVIRDHAVGVPDLVVEIGNRASGSHDRIRKFQHYLRAGVPEYWIVDYDGREILLLVLVNGEYVPVDPDPATGRLASRVLAGFTLGPEDVFAR